MQQGLPITSNGGVSSESKIRPKEPAVMVLNWIKQRPILAILLVSLLAVVVNCYPVIFCGKSYVSPMSSVTLVYNWWPPLPGMARWPARTPDVLHSVHGSDTQAMMWWGVPMGFVESRSLLEQGELPLWNRYNHAGETLIGQAISMFGDPLQLLVIFGHGSAWAWDIKFLAAKFLFCCGLGLLILRLLENHVLSLIYSVLGVYCGAFFYINNHPAFFVFSYAPWILLAAMEWIDLRSGRRAGWGLIWLLANFACFNAGHVELAVTLIAGLNLTALIHALAGCRDFMSASRVLGRMGLGTLLFIGLTAPMWLSFLVSLQGSFTAHEIVIVRHLPTTSLPGVFDDLFYQLLRAEESAAAIAPGTSLLILAGCSFTLARWRQLRSNRFFWVNTGAIIWWAGGIFGWVPDSVFAAIPLFNRVGHGYADFSYLLVLHLTIQSAYGFQCLTKVAKLGEVAVDFACAGGAFAGIGLLYSFGTSPHPVPWNYFICAGAGAIGAPLLFVFLKSRQQLTRLPGWVGILVLGFIPNFRFGLYNFGNDALLMLPGPRAVLNSPSEAVNQIKSDKSGPFRMVGFPWGFMGNYSAVYELEDIRSCSPLSNEEFLNIIRQFPGMELSSFWMIEVVDPVKAQPLLNLLNVKYLLAPPNVEMGGKLDFRLTARSDFGVLENLQVWPRAFFANEVVPINSNEEFIHHLLKNGPQPFIALSWEEIEKQPGLRQLATTNQTVITPATNYRLRPNSTGFDIHAPSAGMVCLTEGQAKEFTALANNESQKVLTVNRAFKGIYLGQPGDYHIQFIYRPRHWRLACACFWISAGTVMALALMSIIHVKGAEKERDTLID
jgi:hypothetical protein